jgi:eukaryotic-like serine/threonine-protein kinase
MSGKIMLHVRNGIGFDQELVFENRAMCVVGRGKECFLRIPQLEVSRRHCQLDIDPPHVRIRDLGSRNGTFLNGDRIGRRPESQSPEEVNPLEMPAHDLKDGDEIGLGTSALISVRIEESAEVRVAKEELEAVGV